MPWFTGWASPWLAVCASNVCPAGSLRRPFWDSSPLMTPIFITWTIPGHFYFVRAVPGAVPTAAASMDGSDGRTDGLPGTGKGLTLRPRAREVAVTPTVTVVTLTLFPLAALGSSSETSQNAPTQSKIEQRLNLH